MSLQSTYDKLATIPISASPSECAVGWPVVLERLLDRRPRIVCVECYPGVHTDELERSISLAFQPSQVFRASDVLKSSADIEEMLAPFLTDDPVFGRMNGLRIEDFLDSYKLARARNQINEAQGRVLVLGTGAALLGARVDVLVYADLARWEIQQRQRRNEISNLGADNRHERASLKYKRAFFVDWRAADRLKKELFPTIDFLLDTHNPLEPKSLRVPFVSYRFLIQVPGVANGCDAFAIFRRKHPTMPGVSIVSRKRTVCDWVSERRRSKFLPWIWCSSSLVAYWVTRSTDALERNFRSVSIFWTRLKAATYRCRFIR
jgi:hypothetical protein